MTLWRLEWLRLVRTRRVVALVAVYLFFGFTAPLVARYINEIVNRFGDVQVLAPPPTPVSGFAGYMSNTNQIALLVFTLVISSAVAFDAQRDMAVFLRTRVPRYRDLLVPRYTLNVAAGAAAFVAGALAAWYGTAILLGPVDAVGAVAGIALSVVYLTFVGAVAALLGSRLTSVVTTAVGTLAVALVLGIAGAFPALGDWLPSHLLGSVTDLAGGGSIAAYARSFAVTIMATAVLLALASRWGDRREL
jgi:ABC-2 type transport system permease protein